MRFDFAGDRDRERKKSQTLRAEARATCTWTPPPPRVPAIGTILGTCPRCGQRLSLVAHGRPQDDGLELRCVLTCGQRGICRDIVIAFTARIVKADDRQTIFGGASSDRRRR